MKRIILAVAILLISYALCAEDYNYKFRLTLKDKGQAGYSIDKPEQFLSKKALERRKRNNVTINQTDLPISQNYLQTIEETGAIIVAKSKWMKTVAVHCTDSSMVEKLKQLPFVSDAKFIWKGLSEKQKIKTDTVIKYKAVEEVVFGNYYNQGYDNIKLNRGELLHDAGFKGKGINLAVIDGGFNNLPDIELFSNTDIKGWKGFVYENEDLFANSNQHGLNVLSCIGANRPFQFVGTAPEASFWLFGTEDSRSEFPVEEDYWATAIEYADSIGIDVVNTSLGYNKFDYPATSYSHSDLDGKTSLISRSANRAVQTGMIVVCSAGNSGNSEWRKITPPSDAEYVLTVGAIQRDSTIAKFSSRGLTADLRVKPDVLALGASSMVINDQGLIVMKSGTSFSSPIMCGLVACLWQANPTLTNRELLRIIKESSDKYDTPDETYGYGIPDMKKAMELAKELTEAKALKKTGK